MFLGGNWQIKELKDALPPEEFAKWGIAPIPQLSRRPGADRHRRLDLGGLLARSRRSSARRRSSSSTSRRRATPRASARRPGRLPVRQSVYRDYPAFREEPFAFFGSMLVVGAGAAGGADLQRDLARAAARHRLRDRRHAHAGAGRRRSVPRGRRRRRSGVAHGRRAAGVGFDRCWVPALVRGCPGRPGARARTTVAASASWLVPAVALVAVFLLYPILELVRVAFTDLGAPGGPYRYTLARIPRARRRSRSSTG